jgi:signal transduction histidine kinase
MVKIFRSYNLLRIVNYFAIVMLLIEQCYRNNIIIFPIFITILIFIINSLFRIYYLTNHENFFLVSSIVEILLGAILYSLLGGFIFLYIFVVVLDLAIFCPSVVSIPTMIGVLFLVLIFQDRLEINLLTLNLINLLVFALLGMHLKKENDKKLSAQDLYDRLRLSEDELKKAYNELELYSKTIEELTLLRERTRLSRELHDSVGHTISTQIIQLQAIKTMVSIKPEKAEEMLEELRDFSKNSLENVRRTVRELKPLEFETFQGIFAIEELTRNFTKLTGVKVKLIVSKEKWRLSEIQSLNLYRIIQEALSNSLRHGHAKNVNISLQFLQDSIYSQIKDDGIGCGEIRGSFGLNTIRERVQELKGTIKIYTEKDKGFELDFTLPKYKGIENDQFVNCGR